MGTPLKAAVSVLVAGAIGACTSAHPNTPCPRNQPAFHIQVTALNGALPADTRLVVKYGGIEKESYTLVMGGPTNLDVCCRPGSVVKGSLPDVACGAPTPIASSSAVPRSGDAAVAQEASVLGNPAHDAATSLHDAATLLHDAAATSLDATTRPHDASTDDASRTVRDAAVAPPTNTEALLCSLWTNGYAAVTLQATGYPDFDHVLVADVPDPRCGGVKTTDYRIVLGQLDAGF